MLDRFELPYKSVYLILDYFDDWTICMTKKKFSVKEYCYKIFLTHIQPIRFIYASISFCQQSAMKTNLLKSWSCLPLFFLAVTQQFQVHDQRSLDCSWWRYTNVETSVFNCMCFAVSWFLKIICLKYPMDFPRGQSDILTLLFLALNSAKAQTFSVDFDIKQRKSSNRLMGWRPCSNTQ